MLGTVVLEIGRSGSILEGSGGVARSVTIRDHEDLTEKSPALRALVTAWIAAKG